MGKIFTRAHARVGLLGNPSDIYGGRGLGFNFTQLGARVELTPVTSPAGGPPDECGGELGGELIEGGSFGVLTAVAADPGDAVVFTGQPEDIGLVRGKAGCCAEQESCEDAGD